MNEKNIPNLTQEQRVLKVLEDANGEWVSGNYFLRNMYLSQYHRAIHNLEHRDKINIEHSEKGEYGFVSYRLPIKNTLF